MSNGKRVSHGRQGQSMSFQMKLYYTSVSVRSWVCTCTVYSGIHLDNVKLLLG